MQIRLDKVGGEPTRWDETLKVDASTLDRVELVELGEISWRGSIRREDGGFPLEATGEYDQTVSCVRCLNPIVESVSTKVNLMVRNQAPSEEEGEVELSADDLEVLYWPEEVLDTRQILQEQLQLNIPMRALCKEDCLGLCPNCGKNRNDSDCDCEPTAVDPRWEVLRGLKE